MLAAAVERLPTERGFEGWQAEPKYDGYQRRSSWREGRCLVQSRRGTDLTTPCPIPPPQRTIPNLRK